MNYFMKIYFSIEIYAESRGPDPHPFNTNELLSRQTLFPIGLLSKKMRELVYLLRFPYLTYPSPATDWTLSQDAVIC